MKKITLLIYCLAPILAMAQSKEINFQSFENWNQVLAKAKEENKTIFIDAYATWCGPCRKMDAEAYKDPSVARYINANFIAIKVQMDQTKNDPASIKNWYTDASRLQKKYFIEALPTFLFVNAAGKQVYRSQGYQNSEAFLAIVKMASDPKENYSMKVDEFKNGKFKKQDLLSLALQAKKYRDDSLAFQIAEKYKKTVIDHSEPINLLNPQFLEFLVNFGSLLNVNDPFVQFMYNDPLKTDSLLKRKGASIGMINFLISKDILNPLLLKNGKIISGIPDWDGLEKSIAKSYNEKLGKSLIVGYKLMWYQEKKDWENLVKYTIERQEINGIDTSVMGQAGLNNLVYYGILKYTDNPIYLTKAMEYMDIALKNNQNDYAKLDTYANLLYKLGRKGEALNIENQALFLAEKAKDIDLAKVFRETILKMKGNLPIPIE